LDFFLQLLESFLGGWLLRPRFQGQPPNVRVE